MKPPAPTFRLLLALLICGGCTVPPAATIEATRPAATATRPAIEEADAPAESASSVNASTVNATQGVTPVAAEPSEPVPATIHQLKLNPANAYLIEAPEGLILVDTSMSFYANRILDAIEQLDKGPLCLIYITHAHIDHYGGASAIREATGAPIAIHELDAEAMERGDTRLGTVRNWEWTGSVTPWVERAIRSTPTTPDILLKDGDAITQCGLDGEVVWTPGHTPGSSSLLVRQHDGAHIFVGDLISNAGSLHIQTSYADDWALLIPSVDKALSFDPDDFYPGHGDAPVSKAAVEEMERKGPAAR